MAKQSHQILGILSSGDREMALPPSTEINELTFGVEKRTIMMLSGVSISLENMRKIKRRPRPRDTSRGARNGARDESEG